MRGFLSVSWWIWAILALIVAGIFAVFVPNQDFVLAQVGWRFFVLRWFHSAVWLFLAASFFIRASQNERLLRFADPIAILGGVSYAIYLFTLVFTG